MKKGRDPSATLTPTTGNFVSGAHGFGRQLTKPDARLGSLGTRFVFGQFSPNGLRLVCLSGSHIVPSCSCLVLGFVDRKLRRHGGKLVLLSCGDEVLRLFEPGRFQKVDLRTEIVRRFGFDLLQDINAFLELLLVI